MTRGAQSDEILQTIVAVPLSGNKMVDLKEGGPVAAGGPASIAIPLQHRPPETVRHDRLVLLPGKPEMRITQDGPELLGG